MRGFHFFCFVALVAGLGLAHAASRVGPPARCLATGKCEAPAPACTTDPSLFVCNQATGYWESNYTELNISLTIGSPVIFLGNFTLSNNASLVWNESTSGVLAVIGTANFSTANDTWLVKVGNEDIDDYAVVEKSGSTNYSASARQIVVANTVIMPITAWKVVAQQAAACHKLYLVESQPTIDSATFTYNGTVHKGQTAKLFFYTKSACWKWIILVGSILAYFAFLVVVIIAFRFVPSLKAWTAQPILATHLSSSKSSHKIRRIDDDSYELEDHHMSSKSLSSGNEGRFSNDSDETDSVRLDI